YAEIGSGGRDIDKAELLTALTGIPARVSRFDGRGSTHPGLRRMIRDLLAAGSPVHVGVKPRSSFLRIVDADGNETDEIPYDLIPGHAYEIVSIDDEGLVELRNPWGVRHPSEPVP